VIKHTSEAGSKQNQESNGRIYPFAWVIVAMRLWEAFGVAGCLVSWLTIKSGWPRE